MSDNRAHKLSGNFLSKIEDFCDQPGSFFSLEATLQVTKKLFFKDAFLALRKVFQ